MTQNSDYTMRLATETDIAAIAAIERDANANPWNEAMLREELEHEFSKLVVAEKDGCIIGFCNIHIAADTAHINEMGVAADHRREGAGRALVAWCVESAKAAGCTVFTLEVRSKNKAAIELYKQSGFKEVARRWGFYKDPTDDALVMLKELNGD